MNNDDKLAKAIQLLYEARDVFLCRCDVAYTSRGKHEPNSKCDAYFVEAVDALNAKPEKAIVAPEQFSMTIREMLEESDARYMLDEPVTWSTSVKFEINGNSISYSRESEPGVRGGTTGRHVIHPNDNHCESWPGDRTGADGICCWCGRTLM